MQSDKSAKVVRRRTTDPEADAGPFPAERARMARGQELKRYVRAAAALQGLYDDTALGVAIGRTRITVGRWWQGVLPEPEAITRIARATGLVESDLFSFVYSDGPPPSIGALESGAREGERRARARLGREAPSTPAPSPERRPRGTGARRG